MSFEYMNKQIISPYTYRKYQKSEYDLFYKESIYNDSIRYYEDKKKKKFHKKALKWQKKIKERELARKDNV